MPVSDLKELHRLYFEERYGYKKIREYIKEKYGWGNDYGFISRHFNRHCKPDANRKKFLPKGKTNALVAEIIQECPTGIQHKRANRNVEKAYDQLVKMTTTYVDTVNTLFDHYRVTFSTSEALLKSFDKLGPIQSLNLLSQLNKMARDQIKDVSAIRAPKVLVMQFMEDTFDRAIGEFNDVVASLFLSVQDEFMKIMEQNNTKNEVSERFFTEVFKRIAISYKERILSLRQLQLMKAADALENLEKVV
jgi:hypothetical protein